MSLAPDDPRHGTRNGYDNHRCRCDACRTAATDHHRTNRTAGYRRDACACGQLKSETAARCLACEKARREPPHGTETRYTSGCRCELCRAASTAARGRRRRAGAAA